MAIRRVAILGNSGAGKSTLARKLSQILDLPVIHLDRHYWQPFWIETPAEQWLQTHAELIAREKWVIDGNYARTLPARAARADVIVFLDPPRAVCLWRAIKRWLTHAGRTREDITQDCVEKIDLEFIQWIWNFDQRSRAAVMETLSLARADQRVFIVRDPCGIEAMLHELSRERGNADVG